jgi:GNAT superfamily N-acetyltransferase
VFGDGIVITHTSGNDGVYGWEDGRRKGKSRRTVVRNYFNKQYRAGNDKQGKEAQINDIAPVKETSSRDGVFFDGEKAKYSLSAETDNSMKNQSHKEKQFAIINEYHPKADWDYQTWITSVDDIKTYAETVEDESNYATTPDFTDEDVAKALKTGKVMVYSSHDIRKGTFVTPSYMEAKNYAGQGKVNYKMVNLTDVAWIDSLQGQYAPVEIDSDVSYSLSLEDIKTKYADKTDYLFLFEHNDTISINNMVVKKEYRNQGIGTQILNDVIAYADEKGKTITLTPTTEYGTQNKLKKWYKANGFVENKGRNADLRLSDTMYRLPKTETKYSLNDIEAKLAVICVRNKINLNTEEDTNAGLVYNLNNAGTASSIEGLPAWVQAVKRTAQKNQ